LRYTQHVLAINIWYFLSATISKYRLPCFLYHNKSAFCFAKISNVHVACPTKTSRRCPIQYIHRYNESKSYFTLKLLLSVLNFAKYHQLHNPSSIPTRLHQAPDPLLTITSASPTCLRSLTSQSLPLSLPLSLSRMAREAIVVLIELELTDFVNPWGSEYIGSLAALPLMTGDCHCKGSDEDDRRLRWR